MLYDYCCSESSLIAENEDDKKLLINVWTSATNKNDSIQFDTESGTMTFYSD